MSAKRGRPLKVWATREKGWQIVDVWWRKPTLRKTPAPAWTGDESFYMDDDLFERLTGTLPDPDKPLRVVITMGVE